MIREIDLDLHGQDLRSSCLADCVEIQAAKGSVSFSEAELADRINDSDWYRLLEPKYIGSGREFVRMGDRQDQSREASRRIFEILNQRRRLLGNRYPFAFEQGRLKLRNTSDDVYLWFLFVSLAHGFSLPDVPDPAVEFERVVSAGLASAGLHSITVGTSSSASDFDSRIGVIVEEFPHLVATLDGVVHSRFANDGGIDTFGSFLCSEDTRHGHWIFVGQSTVGKSDNWTKKIQEVFPTFWNKVFGERVVAIPYFATPHHIQDECLHSLFQNHQRCLLDRIRLTIWTNSVPDSFSLFKSSIDRLCVV